MGTRESLPLLQKEVDSMKMALHDSHSVGDNEGVFPAFFFEPQRGVPMLSRGWRTPDPLPTCDAAGLPRCAPQEIYYDIVQNAHDEEQKTPRHGHDTSTTQAHTPSSPSMRIETLPVPEEELEPTEATVQQSHSLSSDAATAEQYISSASSGNAADDIYALQIPMCSPCFPVFMIPILMAGDVPGTIPETKGCDPAMVSAGSAGHPYTCAEPCKYMTKKRGCKDSAKCDHCHLCVWKPVHGRKNKPRPPKKDRRQEEKAEAAEEGPTSVDLDSEQ